MIHAVELSLFYGKGEFIKKKNKKNYKEVGVLASTLIIYLKQGDNSLDQKNQIHYARETIWPRCGLHH